MNSFSILSKLRYWRLQGWQNFSLKNMTLNFGSK